ncbi:MAG: cysteine desulfurase family protein [Candidatus Acidiferrales bacterium]
MRVYLDHNATTPVDPGVLDTMQPYFSEAYGNASSIHSAGQRARAAVDAARDSVARLIGAKPSEIVFTSGGTEADNLALFGLLETARSSSQSRWHLITTTIEHHAILNAAQQAATRAVDVTFIPVDASGVVDPEKIRAALRPETFLISVMRANNELGTLQPIEEIARIAAEAGVYFHSDAVQAAGKLPLDVSQLGVDLLTVSAHKIYGPKGVGALYVRSGTPIAPQIFGGHHERDRRPGTENVPGIVGFGRAAAIASQSLAAGEDAARMAQLRDKLERGILASVPGILVNGDPSRRISNTSNLAFDGVSGEALLIALDLLGISVSTGAACSSGAVEPSHVLLALGLTHAQADSSIRFSLGRATTAAEIDYTIASVKRTVERMRSLTPVHTTPATLR